MPAVEKKQRRLPSPSLRKKKSPDLRLRLDPLVMQRARMILGSARRKRARQLMHLARGGNWLNHPR